MLRAAAEASSTSAAFCWVPSSIWSTARFIWVIPSLCWRVAVLISVIRSLTRRTLTTISSMVRPALSTWLVPVPTLSTESVISCLISLAAPAERCDSERISAATTANPRPCSPARAASTAAFNARMLVWKAMPSITPMMSTMRREDSLISAMVDTTSCTTCPPCAATPTAPLASSLAWRALSAVRRTVSARSFMDTAVSSSDAACCSVRWDRSALPTAISLAPRAMVSAANLICPMMPAIASTSALMPQHSSAMGPVLSSTAMCPVRSPPCAAATTSRVCATACCRAWLSRTWAVMSVAYLTTLSGRPSTSRTGL